MFNGLRWTTIRSRGYGEFKITWENNQLFLNSRRANCEKQKVNIHKTETKHQILCQCVYHLTNSYKAYSELWKAQKIKVKTDFNGLTYEVWDKHICQDDD